MGEPASGWEVAERQASEGDFVITTNPTRPVGATRNARMPNKVVKGDFVFRWHYRLEDDATPPNVVRSGTFCDTRNRLYVTLADPTPTKLFHTLLELSCHNLRFDPENSPGLSATEYKQDVQSAIWNEFPDLAVARTEFPANMKYWGPISSADPGIFETAGLLGHADGRCGAWARFLVDLFNTQGIVATLVGITPKVDQGVDFEGVGIVVKPSLPGQSNVAPANRFADHAIVREGPSRYYLAFLSDPSYGKSYPPTLESPNRQQSNWEDASLQFIRAYDPVSDTFGDILQRVGIVDCDFSE